MSSTPPPQPLDLGDRPSSPALASPRLAQVPAPSFNPFAPVLPPPGSRSPLVRVKKEGVTAAATDNSSTGQVTDMPKIRSAPFGEIGKEDEEWDAVDAQDRRGGSAFTPSTRERGRPMVRKSFQVRKKDDPATTALGRELGALELAKEKLSEMEKEAEKEQDPPSPKEGIAEGSILGPEKAGEEVSEAVEPYRSPETAPESVDGKEEPMSTE